MGQGFFSRFKKALGKDYGADTIWRSLQHV